VCCLYSIDTLVESDESNAMKQICERGTKMANEEKMNE
jgi:hypothetical protein